MSFVMIGVYNIFFYLTAVQDWYHITGFYLVQWLAAAVAEWFELQTSITWFLTSASAKVHSNLTTCERVEFKNNNIRKKTDKERIWW